MNKYTRLQTTPYFIVILLMTMVLLFFTITDSAIAENPLTVAITQAELMPDDPAVVNQFGYAVAIDGDTAIIGAPFDNSQTGAAYIFVRTAEGWIQQAKLIGEGTHLLSHFGHSVAISGNTVVVGAPLNDEIGAAYIFVRHGESWQQQDKLAGFYDFQGKGDYFGYAVAISGDTVVIGDPKKKIYLGHDSGIAYVFERNGTDWQEIVPLIPNDFSANAFFGGAIAISEDESTVIIGAEGNTHDKMGAAYVFKREGTHWTEQNKLVANTPQKGNKFGASVAISSNMAVVGAIKDAVNEAGEVVGATYVFVRDESGWTKQVRLTAHNASVDDQFGISVAISENTLLVGASEANDEGENTGITYIYIRRGIVWQQPIKLIANEPHPNDRFGNAVAISGDTAMFGAFTANGKTGSAFVTNVSTVHWPIRLFSHNPNEEVVFGMAIAMSGDTLVVGAPFDDKNEEGEKTNTGAAYVFIRRGPNWEYQAKLTAFDATRNDKFGMSVAISGNTIVVGAPNEDGTENNVGSAYVFVRNGTTWTEPVKLTPSGLSDNNLFGDNVPVLFGASVAIEGDTVVVSAPGRFNWKSGSFLPSSVGSAYVFVREDADWHEQTELEISNLGPTDIDKIDLNISVDIKNIEELMKVIALAKLPVTIDGNTIAVGTPLNDNVANDAGLVYIFERINAYWPPTPTYTLTPRSASENDLFGNAVAINGNTMVVGALGIEVLGHSDIKKPSKVYVFNHDGTTWSEQTTLTPSEDTASGFGASVAVSGNSLLVGAPLENMPLAVGAVHEFVYDGFNWIKQPKLSIANAVQNSVFGIAVAMNGTAKVIGMPGYGTSGSQYQGMVYVFPSLTLPSALGGHYAQSVSVELTCMDCQAIHYTLDGSLPTTASPIYAEPIVFDSTTPLRYFSVGAPAGTETITTQIYVIDTSPPKVSITAPQNATTLQTIEITGQASDEDSGGGINQLDRVEMLVQDIETAQYVNLDNEGVFHGWTDTPIWNKATGTTAWQLNTTNVAFVPGSSYLVTARAVDLAGNISGEESTTFTFGEKAFTTLSLSLNSHTILQNSPLSATGKLRRFPSDPDIDWSDETITINITTPEGHTVTKTDGSPYTAKLDQLGNYLIELPSQVFNLKGSYTLQAVYAGSATLLEASSETQTVLVGSSAGYAIIVQGKLTNEEGMEAYDKTLNRVYQRLIDRGFRPEDIRYFNYDDTQTGVDATPTQEAIQAAIETWVRDKLNAVPAPLYLIMVDHGSRDTFYLGDETITPTELNQWLNTLESQLNNTARQEQRSVIIGACYSGSFIPALSKAGRTIVTSAAPWEVSYKGLKEKDGIRSGEFFIEELFQQLSRGASLKAAFEYATQRTEMFTRNGHLSANKANPFLDDAMQHPLLDDNGDGEGHNVLLADDDGQQAASLFLGAGVDFQTNAPDNPAYITEVTPTQYLTDSETSALLFLTVNDPDLVDPAIIEIRPPSKILMAQDSTEQIDIDLENRFLEYNAATGRFEIQYNEIQYNGFIESGRYEIFYTVRDVNSGEISPIQRSIVYKNQPNNSPPNAFALTLPANEAETRTVLVFDWEPAVDPDNNPITYNFIIAEDIHFNKIVHQQEELATSLAIVDDRAGLKDLTQYYWKVEAVDIFGAKTSSDIHSFSTNNPSDGYGVGSFKRCVDAYPKKNCKTNPPPPKNTLIATGEEDGSMATTIPPGDYTIDRCVVTNCTETDIKIHPGQTTEVIFPPIIPPGSLPVLQFSADNKRKFWENEKRVILSVERSGGNFEDGQFSVSYKTSDGTALASNNDYRHKEKTLTWYAQDTRPQQIEISIPDDTDFEPDETFKLTLYNPTGATLGALNQLDITILDNDNPQPGWLKFSSDQYRVDENAGEVQLSVSRVGGSDGDVSVTYTTSKGSALAGSDYTETKKPLFWANGNEQPQTFSVPIQPDQIEEGDEIFVIMLSNPMGGATLGTPQSVQVTIVDVTPSHGHFLFSKAKESFNEDGGTRTFEVNRSDGSDGDVSVEVIVTPDSTAKLDSDFNVEGSLNLTWANGESGPKPITLVIKDDPNWEGNEMVVLGLVNPTGGASLGELQQAQLTIVDNDPRHGNLQFSAATQSADEGDDTVTIEVTRLDGSDGEVEVSVEAVTPDSTATLNEDFHFEGSQRLNWADGDSAPKSITLVIHDDSDREGNEMVVLRLDNATGGASLDEPQQLQLTIVDNDQKHGKLQFSAATKSANEGDGTVTIEVTRLDGRDDEVSVEVIATAGSTATLNSDFSFGPGNPLRWPEGKNEAKSLILNINDDAELESAETIVLRLVNATGGASLGEPSQAELTITDNDKPAGTLQFERFDYYAKSTDSSATITVTREGGDDGKVSVWWGASSGVQGQLEWNPGDNQAKKLTIPIPNNASSVGNNIIRLSLYEAKNGATVGKPSQAVLVIEPPDPKPGLQFPFAAESFNEESDEVLIRVLRIGGSQGEVSVDYTISTLDGTATEDMDFFSETGTLTWADGETDIQTINLLIMDDEIRENPETFYVTLSNPTNGARLGTSKQMVLTIVDNEPTLPSLGNGMAIKSDWQEVPTDTTFTGGITFKGHPFQADVWMPASEPVEINGEIQVAPEHVGKEADILMVAAYQPPDYEHELLLMADTECQILSWDGNLDTLVPVNRKVNLIAKHPINIYKGLLDAGELRIFFGYRLLENGLIVFNGEQSINSSIQPSQ